MNQTIIKYILALLGGGAIGSAVTYFVMNKKFNEAVDAQVDAEVEKIRAEVTEILNAHKADEEEDEEEEEFIPDPEEVAEERKMKAEQARNKPPVPVMTKDYMEKKGYIDYSKLSKEEEKNIVTNEEIDIPDPEEFEMISYEDFNESNGFEKQTLYWLRDRVLVNADGERFRDIGKYIGYDTLDQFGKNNEEDCIYVRNHHERIDFEIYQREETLQTFVSE